MKLWDRFQCWRLNICPVHLDSFSMVCNECEQDRLRKRRNKHDNKWFKYQKSQWSLIDNLKEENAQKFIS